LSMMTGIKNSSGFTLIELAIVLIIAGLLVGLGVGMLGPLTKRAKILETRKLIDAAAESLISYTAGNNKLPATGSFSSVVRNPNDAWTKSLYYITDSSVTSSSGGGICQRKTTRLTLRICPDTGCGTPTSTISNVAFIVLSGAENYNNQTAGTQAVSSATTLSTYEVDVSVDGYVTDMNRVEPYDDIYRWVTLDELRTKAGCDGPQLKVVSNELPYGFQDSAYSATIFADGGIPFTSGGSYNWCREEPVATGLTFTPGASDNDCANEAEGGNWAQADTLVISGTPSTGGSFLVTFFVWDNNDSSGSSDNIASKSLVMTINPAESGGGGGCSSSCTSFRVWNNLGAEYDFFIDGDCRDENDGSEITNGGSRKLDSGETIDQYSTDDESCGGGVVSTITYAQAQSADCDGDCRVNFDGTDR
jgi:prepilin-type N-terminal cleavage/methylation domain-containing protein